MSSIARSLDSIVADLQDAQARVLKSARTTLEEAKRCGDLLIEAKEQVEHGQWSTWIDRNFDGTETVARNYMRIARQWGEIEKTALSAVLGVAEAVKKLAQPNPSGTKKPSKPAKPGAQAANAPPKPGPTESEPPEQAEDATAPESKPTAPITESPEPPAEAEQEHPDAQPDPDSLDAVRADLLALEKQGRALVRSVRDTMGFEGTDATRPYCSRYSKLAVIAPIEQVCRTITNEMPVGGDSDDPILYREQRMKEKGA